MLNPIETAEVIVPKPLAANIEEYCAVRYGDGLVDQATAAMERHYQLLEPLDERELEDGAERPSLTICIPIALLGEDQSTIDRVLDTVHRSQQTFDKPVQVLLWTNAPSDPPSTRLTERYQNMRDSLQRFVGTDLHIKTALQILPEQGSSISQIRSDAMEAAAIDAMRAGQDSDYPVLWLDADTTYLSSNSLVAITEALHNREALFVHATEHFTTEWAAGQPMSERDVATRAIMVSEIHRRKYDRAMKKAGKRMGYPEESGLAFAIGTYLQLGGVNTRDDVNESSTLLSYARSLVHEGRPDRTRSRKTTDELYPGNAGIIEYLPAVKMGLSARRLYEAAVSHGARGISHPPRQSPFGYELFTDGGPRTTPETAHPIDNADMVALLERMETRYALSARTSHVKPDETNVRAARKIMDRAFKD
jgi:hypothetical protein